MPTLFDKDGNEVQAFTQDELDAEKKKAAEEAAKNNPELTKLQEDYAAAQKEIEGFKNKDLNFGNLKELKDASEKKAAELEAQINEIKTNSVKTIETEVFDSLANGDADLKAKLEAEYKTFRGEPKTKEEILAQAKKALSIVKPAVVPGAFDAFSSSNGGRNRGQNSNGGTYTPSPEVAAVGSKMGISDEDFKKYGGQV